MDTILQEILSAIRHDACADDNALKRLLDAHNQGRKDNRTHHAKKKLLPYYLKIKEANPKLWASWHIDEALERQLLQLLRVKPRRTASGVATITVITKPWRCTGNCLYCPNDLRMPKSYLSDEPACQRAERNYFDPYLQVVSRLRALTHMGHTTDKIELIILGGTWSDYPEEYQLWFVSELFRALNDAGASKAIEASEANEASGARNSSAASIELACKQRKQLYRSNGISNREEVLATLVAPLQQELASGALTYNQAMVELYESSTAWQYIAARQRASFSELEEQQILNETAQHRVVGLVVETRPDNITNESLHLLRRLGCTKVQMGIQSVDARVLSLNNRSTSLAVIQNAFALLRLFGFKIHVHFMLNLCGSSPEQDKRDYERLVSEAHYLPDEVKLYPCCLVEGTGLGVQYLNGKWQPYSEQELLDVLMADTLATPPFIRISRMIRDISAKDIVAGNKKANLRQLVETALEQQGKEIAEIRHREISTNETVLGELALNTTTYETTVSTEHFLQWITPENNIAGFLRLSLPQATYVRKQGSETTLPVKEGEAMIREVHIYGKVAGLKQAGISESAQHLGLGRQLIAKASAIARSHNYTHINVISSVGTREYYRKLGFEDNGLYQQKAL